MLDTIKSTFNSIYECISQPAQSDQSMWSVFSEPKPEPTFLENAQTKMNEGINYIKGVLPSMDREKIVKTIQTFSDTLVENLPSANITAGLSAGAGLGLTAASVVALKKGYNKTAMASFATGSIATLASATFAGYQAYKTYMV